MNQQIFVTGTDTGAGKTVVCGLLARFLIEKGKNVVVQKWIETGDSSDIKEHQILSGIEHFQHGKHILPYKFKYPASPHLASAMEKRRVRREKIRKSFLFLRAKFDVVIVEGTGGLLVPFNRKGLLIDIVKGLGLSVLIVAKNKLGAINHTLLTLEALKARNMEVLGIVFNDEKEEEAILSDNPKIIKALSKIMVFGRIPYQKNRNNLYESFKPIGDRIWSLLRKT
ncbi:MAG: dethiobiotin synthase [bacterium]|nr:dethiobiotin synthase [bacterium]